MKMNEPCIQVHQRSHINLNGVLIELWPQFPVCSYFTIGTWSNFFLSCYAYVMVMHMTDDSDTLAHQLRQCSCTRCGCGNRGSRLGMEFTIVRAAIDIVTGNSAIALWLQQPRNQLFRILLSRHQPDLRVYPTNTLSFPCTNTVYLG